MVDFQSYLSILLICLVSTILIRRIFKSTGVKTHLPPSPFAFPIIGHFHLLALIPHQALHKLSLRFGPVYRLILGYKPCIVVCSPETAKEFLKTHENAYLDRPHNLALDYLTYGMKDLVSAPYGPYCKFVRKILISQLLNGPTLDSLSYVRHDEINCLIKSLSQKAQTGKSVDMSGEFVKLIKNVIIRMLIGERWMEKEGDAYEVRKLVTEIIEMVGSFNLSDHIWLFKNLDLQGMRKKFTSVRARFDSMIERVIKEHEEETREVKDLLHILLDLAQDESIEIKMSRDNIKALIMDILIGGTDTAGGTLEWGLALLINHPNIMKKVIQEIHLTVGENRILQESDIHNLPYLQAIVKETLRLYPPASVIPRQSTQSCTVAGYHIPADTTIFVNTWALGRDLNHWENPLEFRPERFMDTQLGVKGQHFHMLPFGSGRRLCPGISLGLLMVHTTLGAMIQCFDWKAGKDGNLASVDMEEASAFTLTRANPLLCIPVARLDPILFSS